MQLLSKLSPSDLRTLMQIVTIAFENEASSRIIVRELCLSEEEIERLYELAEQIRRQAKF